MLTQMKQTFKRERILAKKNEDLSSHRLLANYELDEGIIADLVLKNGAMHVIETVDASSDLETARKAIAEIAVSALILERARMKFEGQELRGKLIYEANSNLERIARRNWLATPLSSSNQPFPGNTPVIMGKLKFH
ncbi:MAG: hypothetical protein WDN29_13405 [Methylovirgula sp.]